MTVKELIKALEQMPQNAFVDVTGSHLNDFDSWEDVFLTQIRKIENHENYVEIIME